MKTIRSFLIIAVGYLMAGCDGHIETLKINTTTGGVRPLFARSSTIYVKSGNTVPGVVSNVANTLDLVPMGATNSWWAREEHGSFGINVGAESDGWVVGLLDWPAWKRSDKSRLAEKLIRVELKDK
jgi:hypothetical protein